MDINKDGKVSFPEFLIVMKHGNPVGSLKPQNSDETKVGVTPANTNHELNIYIHQQGALRIQ